MPDDALIERLDTLRESYSGRLRAANGLLTALKGSTGALSKANRAFRDYAEGDPSPLLDEEKLACARQAFESSRLKDEAVDPLLPELRRETKALTDAVAALRDAATSLRGEAVDVVKLDKALTTLRDGRIQDDAISALLPSLDDELQQGQVMLGATFGDALRHALAERGVSAGGRPPRYEVGRFEIDADFAKRGASISYGKELVVKRVPLSVEAVVRAYEREVKAIMGRNEDPQRWMESFRNAWELARRQGAGGRANITACYFQFVLLRQSRGFRAAPGKGTIVDYTRAQFAYDFYELTQRQRLAYDGKRVVMHPAAKSQAESAERSIFIVQGESPHDGEYIGDVSFE